MEMEISIQDYLNVILKWWTVIIAVFIGALVVSAAVSFWQPPVYEASVTMYEPSYRLRAEEAIESAESIQQPLKLYKSLAKSSAVEAKVAEALGSTLSPAEKPPGSLLSAVTVVANKDNPALFEIKARHTDPEIAVLLANTWASEYIEMFGELSTGSATELGFIRGQLALAESDLESAERALKTFEQETGLGTAPNQEYGSELGFGIQDPYAWYGTRGKELEAKSELLANHRVARDNILLLLDIAQGVKESGGGVDDLPLQLLAVQAVADRGQLSAEVILQEAEGLDTIMELLQTEERSLASVIEVLSSEVDQLHTELMQDKYEYLLLNHTRNAILERSAILSRKAHELELQSSGVRIINPAVRPEVASPSPWLNVIVAGVLGLFVGVMLAFGLEYLRGPDASSSER